MVPTKRAADLEGSKAFLKIYARLWYQNSQSCYFDSYVEADQYIQNHSYPLVIKASGLASGKRVVICEDKETAHHTLHQFMIERIYGDAGIKVVIEEFLQGFGSVYYCFWNGEKAFSMCFCQRL